eukprot:363692-Chlamydomonas_euryale.AAC.12
MCVRGRAAAAGGSADGSAGSENGAQRLGVEVEPELLSCTRMRGGGGCSRWLNGGRAGGLVLQWSDG